MSLVGKLSEFPLPEVLLLIGSRTGCLRLYNVPDLAVMEMDLSEGQAHGLRVGDHSVLHPDEMVTQLSFIVETADGMFEFQAQPIISVRDEEPLPISQLVMRLVLHVDEKLAKQRALMAPQLFYMLEKPAPAIWLEPGLNTFFKQTRQLLSEGVRTEDLAEYLGQEEPEVEAHLERLRRLGLVKLLETSDVESLRTSMVEQEISRKTDDFFFAYEASEILRRSGKLLKLPVNKS